MYKKIFNVKSIIFKYKIYKINPQESKLVILILLAVYYAMIFIVIRKKYDNDRINDYSGFFLADRQLGSFLGSMTYAATTYSSFMMIGLVGFIFNTGIGTMYFELSYLFVTFFVILVFGNKLRQLSADYGFVSPMELFHYKYGNVTPKIGALVCLIALLPYTAGQFIGIGMVLQSFGIDYNIGVLIAAGVTFSLMLAGGMRGVALSDAVQAMVILLGAFLAYRWSKIEFIDMDMIGMHKGFWTPTTFANFTIPWVFFALTNPQVVQRLFAIKDNKAIKQMAFLFAIYGLVFTLIVSAVGFYATKAGSLGAISPDLHMNSVTPELLKMMPWHLGQFIALSILFAALSTTNSILLTLTSMVKIDLIQANKKTKNKIITTMILLTIAVLVVALFKPSYIVSLALSTARLLLGFVPLYLGLLFKPNARNVTSVQGVTTVLGTAILTMVYLNVIPQYNSALTLGSAFAIYIVTGFFTDRYQA